MDRNFHVSNSAPALPRSLSARRAWIETFFRGWTLNINGPSLSARRAWIETIALFDFPVVPVVALRKESVDRNDTGTYHPHFHVGRSPQGERG